LFIMEIIMKINFNLKLIDKFTAVSFIQKYHYSPVMPSITKYYLGFFIENNLKGVLTLGYGTQPRHTFNKMFPTLEILKKNKDNNFESNINDWYYEIGKMCLSSELNGQAQAGSQMVSATIKWLKTNTKCLFLYTMADGIMGKCGFVYQASNFYFGEKYFTSVYLTENGEKLHPRSARKLCKENAKFLGKEKVFWLTTDFMLIKNIKKINGLMFRYLYPLNKKAKKIMLKKSSLFWSKQYPKEDSLEWIDVTDKKNKIKISKPAFTFKKAKYNLKNIEAHKNTKYQQELFI